MKKSLTDNLFNIVLTKFQGLEMTLSITPKALKPTSFWQIGYFSPKVHSQRKTIA